MFYRIITTVYTDALAYISAFITVVWFYLTFQNPSIIPDYLSSVSPFYGLCAAVYFGATLICKHICIDGNELQIHILNSEKTELEVNVKHGELLVVDLKRNISNLHNEISLLQNKIKVLEENSVENQLTELRIKLRSNDEDKKSALSVLVKNLQIRLNIFKDIQDTQLVFASNVLRQEVGLLESELKRGELSYYELCIKIAEINEKIAELTDISHSLADIHTQKTSTSAEAWLNFIRANDISEQATVDKSFKFFKVAFHPDRFPSESLKVEATRYFKHSINVHSAVKRMENATQ